MDHELRTKLSVNHIKKKVMQTEKIKTIKL